MAAFVVDARIVEGKLPVFGAHARDLILDYAAGKRPDIATLLTSTDHYTSPVFGIQLERWCHALRDAAWVSFPLTTERGHHTVFSNYLNRKISERWNCRGKSVVKCLPTSVVSRGRIEDDDYGSANFRNGVASWVRVPASQVTWGHMALFAWRAGKALGGNGLKADVEEARARIKGMKRSEAGANEFDIARGVWRREIEALRERLQQQVVEAGGCGVAAVSRGHTTSVSESTPALSILSPAAGRSLAQHEEGEGKDETDLMRTNVSTRTPTSLPLDNCGWLGDVLGVDGEEEGWLGGMECVEWEDREGFRFSDI